MVIGVQGETVHAMFDAMQNGFSSDTGNPAIDAVLSSGGVLSMTWLVTLTFFALGLAGMLKPMAPLMRLLSSSCGLSKGASA